MADYASDSSEGEFTETNVLLGYTSKEAEEDTISKLGGTPVSLSFFLFLSSLR
jgi:pre-rRNA-processing protein TSR4